MKSLNSFAYKMVTAFMIVMLALTAMPVSSALAATSGPNSPTSTSGTGANWVNPANALSSNTQYATFTGNTQQYLILTGFGFAIPAGNAITGIQVSVKGLSSGSSGNNRTIQVALTKNGTAVVPGSADTQQLNTTDATFGLGSTTDLWNTTWSLAEINSGTFGVMIRDNDNNSNGTFSIDYVSVTITYLPTYTITVTQGANGTITPGTTSVVQDADQTFNIAPNAGFIVNDVVIGPPSTSLGRANSYTFENVDADGTITASFDGGWSRPTANVNPSANNAWVNPTGAYLSDNSRATNPNFIGIALPGSVDYFNFNIPAIPAGSTIDGIEVAMEGTSNTAVDVILSGSAGIPFTPLKQGSFSPGVPESTIVLGGPNDKWNPPFTWVPSDFTNAEFRMRISFNGQITTNFSLDQVQVKVYYTPPPLTVTINQEIGQADPTNVSPINFTVVFNHAVADFTAADVALTGSTAPGAIVTNVIANSSTNYTVQVGGMTGNGTVIASIPAGGATDSNGTLNSPSTSTDNTVTYDATPPTATIDLQDASDTGISNTDNLTNASSPIFDVAFSEAVTGLDLGDFSNLGTATGCTFAVGAPTGDTYPVTVSGCSEGTLVVSLAAGAVTDTAGSQNVQTDGPTVTIDRTGPSVTINQSIGQPDPTGVSPINFTAVFSEAASGFDGLDVTLSGTANPTVANVTGGPATYTVAVSNMTTDGTVIASIGVGVATDAAGNGNLASTSTDNIVTFDSIAPIASINLQASSDSGISSVDNITNVASPVFDVSFDKVVIGLANNDFSNVGTATGCTFAVGVPTGNIYPVTVSTCSQGTLIVRLAAAAVTDIALNPNAQTTGPTVTIDRTGPNVTINQAVGQNDPTNVSPIEFTAVFSELVTNFATGDVVVTGTASATTGAVTGSGTTYTVAVSDMTGDGTVIASINAGVATDAAGNNNTVGTVTDNTVTYDTTAPTVTINQKTTAPAQADPTNASPIHFTVVFSESVTGFAGDDVSLLGTAGATTAVVTGSGTTYNVAVSGMVDDGDVIAAILAGGALDTAGNGNLASTSIDNIVTYDILRPTVTIDQKTSAPAQADPTSTSPIHFTVVFSEPVTGFINTDVRLIGTAGATTAVVTGSGTTYDVAVSGMTQSGTVIASILVNAAQDVAGNSSFVSTSGDNTVFFDNTAPTVTIDQDGAQADPTGTAPINFAVVFSEPINSATFTDTDIALSGTATGTLTAVVTGSGNTYNVAVSGMVGSGTVIAAVIPGSVQDFGGNNNAASTSGDNIVTFDATSPSVTVNQAASQVDPTNGSPISFTVVFSEAVTDFTNTDVVMTGTATGTMIANVTGGGNTYNVAVSGMTGSGTVIVTIPANSAIDGSGNGNSASTSTDNTVTFDITRPTVTINQAAGQADPTGFSPIDFTVVFSEPVTDFAAADITLSGAAGATTVVISGGGAVYNVAVSGMTASGAVIATVNAAAAMDVSNNTSFASTSTDNTVTYDNTALSVTINQAALQIDPTNIGPINFTVIFSKPVTGFVNTDVTLAGTATGPITAVVTGTGTTYNVEVSGMTGSGTVIATVPAGSAQDTAGNGNTNSSSTDNIVTFDVTPPTVTINQAVGQADPTNVSPVNFTVVFSEAVTGFTNADVTLTGTAGAINAAVTGSGTTYTVSVSGMTASGTVIVSIPAASAADAAGNNSAASTSTDNTVTYDNVIPSVTINQAAAQVDPTNTSPINFTVIFSKPVTGFIGTDVAVSGTAGATTAVVTGTGTTYNVAVSGMVGSGTVVANIPAGVAVDASGNANIASASADNSVLYDITIPTVTINQAAGQADPTGISPINFTVIFSEPVTGFTGGDVALSGTAGATTAVVTGSGATYNVAVGGMTASGTVIAIVAAGNAQDAAGNNNANSTSTDNNVTYDNSLPTVTINQAAGQTDPTSASPITFEVLFSKPVTGFTGGDVTLGGTAGATTAVVTGAGTTYTVAVSGMTLNGTVIPSIPAGAAADSVGNTNPASTSTDNTVTYDTAGPTVMINQAAAQIDPTSTSPINFTVVFSEPVTGFTNADLNLGGSAGATTVVVSGTGANYNVAASGMTVSGTVFVSITDAAGIDAAGNPSLASTSTDNTVTYDTGVPSVTINQAAGQVDPTNISPISFTVIFSKPVTGFTNADVVLTGTAGANTAVVSGTGANYNVVVSGMTGSGTVIAAIPAGRAQDSAGNDNLASTSTDNTVLYDNTGPTLTIDQAAGQADPTNASTINFTVVFSEPVLGFTSADVTLGGTAGATTVVITGSGANYNVAVSGMVTDGTITAAIGAGVVTDVVGNPNSAGTSTDNEVSYNTTTPTVTIDQAAGQADPTNISPINFTVTFSELIVGFTDSDVIIGGTAGANLAVISGGGPTYTVTVSGMTNDGTVIISIPANAVTDPSSNGNSASNNADNTVTYLDGNGPNVQVINTSPATGDNVLSNAEIVPFDITQFIVKFNQPLYNPAGDSDTDDVTNPNNYLLIRDLGDTAGLQTVSCSSGAVVPADTKIAIGTVTYDNETYTATFTINSGLPLTNGDYHLFVCGTTSIVDPLNNALGLVGTSGLPNTDFRGSFTVNVTGGGGGGGSNSSNAGTRLSSGVVIPVTGFAPGKITTLPKQPADKAYKALGDLTIEIPTLGIKYPIIGVSLIDNNWDLTWMKDSVGYLEGSAYPTFNGNTVLTAHVLDSNNNLGPFSDIKGMQMGDRIYIRFDGKIYIYEVQENRRIRPFNISAVFKHQEYSWITLVTCEDYNAKTGHYSYRRMVRAVLISVVAAP